LTPWRRAQVVQNSRKIKKMDSMKFNPLLELGGPWEGLSSENPFPSIHSLTQSMASKHHLMKKKKKIHITQVWACNHHHQLHNMSAKCGPWTFQGELSVFKIQEKKLIMHQKNFTPPLELRGPCESRSSETPLPSIHSMA
jgi:hypothetical protein